MSYKKRQSDFFTADLLKEFSILLYIVNLQELQNAVSKLYRTCFLHNFP